MARAAVGCRHPLLSGMARHWILQASTGWMSPALSSGQQWFAPACVHFSFSDHVHATSLWRRPAVLSTNTIGYVLHCCRCCIIGATTLAPP